MYAKETTTECPEKRLTEYLPPFDSILCDLEAGEFSVVVE